MHNKEYMKASQRREGFIEKPFKKLTPDVLEAYLIGSNEEFEKIHPIILESPHLFEASDELCIWKSIYNNLEALGINNDVSKKYDYKGIVMSLRFYLEARGGIEDNALMVTTAYALNVALAKAYCMFHENFYDLSKVVDAAYYAGKTISLTAFQKEIVAGSFRTSAASKEKSSIKKEKINLTRLKAIELKAIYPNIKKVEIAELLHQEIDRSKSTVRDYLKGIEL